MLQAWRQPSWLHHQAGCAGGARQHVFPRVEADVAGGQPLVLAVLQGGGAVPGVQQGLIHGVAVVAGQQRVAILHALRGPHLSGRLTGPLCCTAPGQRGCSMRWQTGVGTGAPYAPHAASGRLRSKQQHLFSLILVVDGLQGWGVRARARHRPPAGVAVLGHRRGPVQLGAGPARAPRWATHPGKRQPSWPRDREVLGGSGAPEPAGGDAHEEYMGISPTESCTELPVCACDARGSRLSRSMPPCLHARGLSMLLRGRAGPASGER